MESAARQSMQFKVMDCRASLAVTIERDDRAVVDAVAMKQDNRAMQTSLASQLPSIAALCERYGVAHLELFGSATGPDFKPEASDFDFLVELDRQAPGSRARRWIELAESLEKLLGRPVDLVNPHYIRNPYFLQSVNQSRTVVYDRPSTQAAV